MEAAARTVPSCPARPTGSGSTRTAVEKRRLSASSTSSKPLVEQHAIKSWIRQRFSVECVAKSSVKGTICKIFALKYLKTTRTMLYILLTCVLTLSQIFLTFKSREMCDFSQWIGPCHYFACQWCTYPCYPRWRWWTQHLPWFNALSQHHQAMA